MNMIDAKTIAASLPAGIHTITFSMPVFAELCKEFRESKGKKK
jgi:hypothetical protein